MKLSLGNATKTHTKFSFVLLAIGTLIASSIISTAVSAQSLTTTAEVKAALANTTLRINGQNVFMGQGRLCWKNAKGKIIRKKWKVRRGVYFSNWACKSGCKISKSGGRISFLYLDTKKRVSFRTRRGKRADCN
ncbi:MAG: hypothetical protein AAF035_06845 [Pseudomonadota bacterium]